MRFYKSTLPMAATLQILVACLSCLKGVKATPVSTNPPPTVVQQPNAPAGVPDYVIKYGMNQQAIF